MEKTHPDHVQAILDLLLHCRDLAHEAGEANMTKAIAAAHRTCASRSVGKNRKSTIKP